MYDADLRSQVCACLDRVGSTGQEWRAALDGEAEVAVRVALEMVMPTEIDARLDLTMTMLSYAAFHDSSAASVMADLVERAPLEEIDCLGISTSWRVHKIWLESAVLNKHKWSQSAKFGDDFN